MNLPLLRGLRLITGYFGLETSSVLDTTDPVTQRIAGVAWRASGSGWVHVADSMPRARLVPTARPSENIKADIHAIDISGVALVGQPIEALDGSEGEADSARPSSVRIVADRPGSIVLETTTPARQLLVVTERFHDGWRATEDDRERETTRVYGDYLGCVVEAGQHRVTLRFAPDSARQGLRASFAGVALTLLMTTILWRVRTHA